VAVGSGGGVRSTGLDVGSAGVGVAVAIELGSGAGVRSAGLDAEGSGVADAVSVGAGVEPGDVGRALGVTVDAETLGLTEARAVGIADAETIALGAGVAGALD